MKVFKEESSSDVKRFTISSMLLPRRKEGAGACTGAGCTVGAAAAVGAAAVVLALTVVVVGAAGAAEEGAEVGAGAAAPEGASAAVAAGVAAGFPNEPKPPNDPVAAGAGAVLAGAETGALVASAEVLLPVAGWPKEKGVFEADGAPAADA